MNRTVLQPAAAGQPQNTPTRDRGAPERKRDDAQRSSSRAIICAGSRKDRSAIPDSDPKVNGSQVRAPLRRSGAAFFESVQSDSSVADDSVGPVNYSMMMGMASGIAATVMGLIN